MRSPALPPPDGIYGRRGLDGGVPGVYCISLSYTSPLHPFLAVWWFKEVHCTPLPSPPSADWWWVCSTARSTVTLWRSSATRLLFKVEPPPPRGAVGESRGGGYPGSCCVGSGPIRAPSGGGLKKKPVRNPLFVGGDVVVDGLIVCACASMPSGVKPL